MNILISGGAGFIGSHLALRLKAKNYNVTVLDNLSEQVHGKDHQSLLYNSVKDAVRCIIGDVTNNEDWIRALENQDMIVHLAAETGTGQSMYQINQYIETNIGGTAKLLDILTNQDHHIQKVIIASSRAIYGEGKYKCQDHGVVYPEARSLELMKNGDFTCKCPFCRQTVKPLPTDESSKIHPTSVYGITKSTQEQLVLAVCKSIGIPAVALRYQNVFGPGQSLLNPYTGILSIFSNQIRNNEQINIFEDGCEGRDFVYINDAVNATILAMEKDTADFESLNVGTGVLNSVEKVAGALVKCLKRNPGVKVTGNFRMGDIRHNYADLTKIKNLLGYSPSVDFEQGAERFVEWVMQQDHHESKLIQSLKEMKEKGLFYGK
jgi:dTDP-L-rhamnose 4-epimerase